MNVTKSKYETVKVQNLYYLFVGCPVTDTDFITGLDTNHQIQIKLKNILSFTKLVK